MISFNKAKQIAEAEISRQRLKENDPLTIIDEAIIEKEYAWIFPYTSKKHLETNDINYALAGNGPLFISKFNGQVSVYRTGITIEEMIDEHEEENKLWALHLVNKTLDIKSTLIAKKILGWTAEQLIRFKNTEDSTLVYGSKRRLAKLQSLLSSSKINTNLTLAKLKC